MCFKAEDVHAFMKEHNLLDLFNQFEAEESYKRVDKDHPGAEATESADGTEIYYYALERDASGSISAAMDIAITAGQSFDYSDEDMSANTILECFRMIYFVSKYNWVYLEESEEKWDRAIPEELAHQIFIRLCEINKDEASNEIEEIQDNIVIVQCARCNTSVKLKHVGGDGQSTWDEWYGQCPECESDIDYSSPGAGSCEYSPKQLRELGRANEIMRSPLSTWYNDEEE